MLCDFDLVNEWLSFIYDNPAPLDPGEGDHLVCLYSAECNMLRLVVTHHGERGFSIPGDWWECPAFQEPITWSPGGKREALMFVERFRKLHRRGGWFAFRGDLHGWIRGQVNRYGGMQLTSLYERGNDLRRLLSRIKSVQSAWPFARRRFFPHRRDLNREFAEGHSSVVYFLLADQCRRVKIGTSTNLFTRFERFQDAAPCRLSFLGTTAGGSEIESKIHVALTRYRKHGEWFEWNGELQNAVTSLMSDGMIPQLGVNRILELG